MPRAFYDGKYEADALYCLIDCSDDEIWYLYTTENNKTV